MTALIKGDFHTELCHFGDEFLNEIHNIPHVIGIHLSPEELKYLSDNLFGIREIDKTQDYSVPLKGQINQSQELFNKELVNLLKEHYNYALLFFNYEKIVNGRFY